jgi:hypothetical protein
VIQGLSLSDNSPLSGYISWSACTLVYNGVSYSITPGSTNSKYVYWKDLTSAFSASATHPSALSDWVPGEDFIIATNVSGVGQQAWNAMANQVMGSAWIMDAAIGDAQVSNLSGTKIRATSSIAIGSDIWGDVGIQLDYNAGDPRFYVGDGDKTFFKLEDGKISVSTEYTDAIQIRGGGSILLCDQDDLEIGRILSQQSGAIGIYPTVDGNGTLILGGSSLAFGYLYAQVELQAMIIAQKDADEYVNFTLDPEDGMTLSHSTADGLAALRIASVMDSTTFRGITRPTTNNNAWCGKSDYAWHTVFAYNLTDVGDHYFMDRLDDVGLLRQIKGSGVIEKHTGLELIDDATLPAQLLHRDQAGKVVRNEADGGKPYISHKAMLSLLRGAIVQVDERLRAVEAGKKRR